MSLRVVKQPARRERRNLHCTIPDATLVRVRMEAARNNSNIGDIVADAIAIAYGKRGVRYPGEG